MKGARMATGATLAVGTNADYTPSYTLTQDDVDKKGNPVGTGNIKNTATAVSGQTPSQDSSVTTPVDYNPFLTITKPPTSTLFPYTTLFRSAGDVIKYDVLVTNTGD